MAHIVLKGYQTPPIQYIVTKQHLKISVFYRVARKSKCLVINHVVLCHDIKPYSHSSYKSTYLYLHHTEVNIHPDIPCVLLLMVLKRTDNLNSFIQSPIDL